MERVAVSFTLAEIEAVLHALYCYRAEFQVSSDPPDVPLDSAESLLTQAKSQWTPPAELR